MRFGQYVKFTARPGQRDALASLLLPAPDAPEMAGCELYIVNRSPAEADVLWVTEVWASRADMDASLAQESVRARIANVMPLLASMPEAIPLEPVGGIGLDAER